MQSGLFNLLDANDSLSCHCSARSLKSFAHMNIKIGENEWSVSFLYIPCKSSLVPVGPDHWSSSAFHVLIFNLKNTFVIQGPPFLISFTLTLK